MYSTSNVDCIEKELKVFIPNSFSPNGDDINDRFKISGQAIKDYQIKIYNRWEPRFTPATNLKKDGTAGTRDN
jgi:gliding motility-associated-like protein